MIWARRAIALLLSIVFFGVFACTLTITHVNGTVGNGTFYKDQMDKADIYNFVYDSALPAALEEVEENEAGDGFPVDLKAIEGDLVSAARQSIPPEWLKAQFEAGIDVILPYFLGSKDDFTYTLAIDERFEATVEVIKTDILNGPAFTSIYDDLISYGADKVIENLSKLPYELTLGKAEVEASLRQGFPKDWMAAQLEDAIDSMKPYMMDKSDRFSVTFHFEELVVAIADAGTELMSKQATYEYVLDEMITPTIQENIDRAVQLPFEVSLTTDEISGAVKEVMPESWVQARLEEVIDEIAGYARGTVETIEVSVDLDDRKTTALDTMTDLADRKIEEIYEDLRPCSEAEFLRQVATLSPGELPDCRPYTGSYEEFKASLGVDVEAIVRQAVDDLIGDEIPDRWTFTEDDLREAFGEENEQFLDDMRTYVMDGWTLTEADLHDNIEEGQEDLDKAREYIGGGYTVADQDITDEMDSQEREDFDESRDTIDTIRSWLWLMWLGSFVLLVAIGLLGGRSWKGKLLWAFGALFVTALVLTIGTAVAASVADEKIDTELDEAFELDQHDGFELVIREKGREVSENSIDAFLSGMKNKPLYATILSGVALLGILGWMIVHRRESSRPGFSRDGDWESGPSDVEGTRLDD